MTTASQLELFQSPPPFCDAPLREHQLLLRGRLIPYRLRRDRKRLALRIDERGLSVGAPRILTLAAIEVFIAGHADWVLEKLDAHARRCGPRHLHIADGTQLPVLGEPVSVRVVAGGNRGYWQDGVLWLAAQPGADLARLARRALQRRALELFRPRIEHAASRLAVPVPLLALSSARTRWGSCSSTSGIRLNWRLIHLPNELIDYVIAHEAAHLVEMNHSPRFWAQVGRLFPDWRTARTALKQQGADLPLI